MTALEASKEFQPANLWFYVARLLRLRVLIFASGFKRSKLGRKLLILFLGLLALGACVGSYLLTTAFLDFVESPLLAESGVDLSSFVKDIPALVFTVVFLGILLFSFGVLLQGLYLANDMDFLLAAPVPIRAVFLTKLLQAIIPNFAVVLIIGLPVLIGLGTDGGYNLLYYPLVLVVLALLSLAAAGISSLLVMGVVRIFPAKRVAEVLALLAAVIFFIVSQLPNLTRTHIDELTPEQISSVTQVLSTFNSPASPLAWAGRGLVDLGEGRWLSGILFLALAAILSAGVFWFALKAAERLYYSGWASIRVSAGHKKNHRASNQRTSNSAAASSFGRFFRSQVWAIVVKDFKGLWRDLSNLSQVIGVFIMGIVFTVMLLRSGGVPPAGKGEAPAVFMDLLRFVLAYGSMVIAMFVGWGLLARLALVSFSMEGRSYWILKTAPVSARKLLAAKFLMAFLPSLVLSWLYLLVIAFLQKVPASIILYGLPSSALILAGLCGINLAFGVTGANLTWTDPRKMESGTAGCLGMIISVAYQLATILLFFGPPAVSPMLGLTEGTGQLVGLLAGGVFTLFCTILPLKLVKNRVGQIGEEQTV